MTLNVVGVTLGLAGLPRRAIRRGSDLSLSQTPAALSQAHDQPQGRIVRDAVRQVCTGLLCTSACSAPYTRQGTHAEHVGIEVAHPEGGAARWIWNLQYGDDLRMQSESF